MRKWIVASVFVLALAIVTTSWATGHQAAKVLDVKTMIGVVPPYVGSPTNAALTRGIQRPAWLADRPGQEQAGEQRRSRGRGRGARPRAAQDRIRCPRSRRSSAALSIDSNGQASTVNQVTDAFPATMPGGDAEFDGSVSLPSPCIAPIVFVTTAGTGLPHRRSRGPKPRERGAANTGAPLPLRNRARLAPRQSPS